MNKVKQIVVFAVNLIAGSILLGLLKKQLDVRIDGALYAVCILEACTMLLGARLLVLGTRVWEREK